MKRFSRLVLATALIPAASAASYLVAQNIDGDSSIIDQTGSGVGVMMMLASVLLISLVASPEQWSERAAISVGLSTAYFLITWLRFGDPASSVDDAPHFVWYGACVAVFSPAVVLVVASKWFWESFRARRADFFVQES